MAAHVNQERSRINNAQNWAKMMVDPLAKQVVAPSYMPRPTCSSTLVKSIDIPYSSTNAGYVTIALNPDPNAHYLISSNTNFPVGGGEVSLVSSGTSFGIQSGYVNYGFFDAFGVDGAQQIIIPVIADGSVIGAGAAGMGLIPFATVIGSDYDVSIAPDIPCYIEIYEVNFNGTLITKVVGPTWVTKVGAVFNQTAVQGISYLSIKATDGSGLSVFPLNPLPVRINIHGENATIASSSNSQIISAVRTELMAQAHVSHAFMTSGHLLCTNLASPLDSGGEIVVARVLKSTLEAHNTQELMDHIKSLSEKRMYKSLPLVEGGYVWYLPDDISSYSPAPIAETGRNDNVLVACVKMASESGQVRVNFTSRWDYYSPSQILPKKTGHTWCPASLALLEELSGREAVSGNPTHLALVAAAKAAADLVGKFYLANRAWIDPMAIEAGTKLARSAVKAVQSRQKRSNKQK